MSHRRMPPWPAPRNAQAIAGALDARRAGFVPEWTALQDAGTALHRVLARQLEVQGEGLNGMPQRAQLAFLESLGADLLPARPARAPLVFTLQEGASGDATVPQGTRVGAVLPPPSPSLESSDDDPEQSAPAPEFFTEQEITAMRGRLAALYSIDPQADTFADHGHALRAVAQGATTGSLLGDGAAPVTSFDAWAAGSPVPHRLLLGHGELFRLSGNAQIELTFDFAPSPGGVAAAPRALLLDWEYWSVDGWQPLVLVSDGTQRFTRDGKVVLAKVHGPDAEPVALGGHESCWIRATVSSRVPGARVAGEPAGYLVRYAMLAPEDRLAHAPAGFWLRVQRWLGAPLFVVGNVLRIGAQQAQVLAVQGERLVVDAPLPDALDGAVVRDGGGQPVGHVLPGPALAHELAWGLAGDPAPRSAPVATRAVDGTHAILAQPLAGVAGHHKLFNGLGDEIATVIAAPAPFRVAVDSARDLQQGDRVSADGRHFARVVQTEEQGLYLDAELAALQAGWQVELDDALPPLRPDGADEAGVLPLIDVVRARVGLSKTDLPPDKALLDGFVVDTSKDFAPFGEQPARHAAFYVACKEAFSRPGARIELEFRFTQTGSPTHSPQLAVEVFNGVRWMTLGAAENLHDTSDHLTASSATAGMPPQPSATLAFDAPLDWAESEINGDTRRWLRLRLASGHYGVPQTLAVKGDPDHPGQFIVEGAPADLRPPIIARLGISYRYFTAPHPPQACLAENDFALTDHSENARWPRSAFAPFQPVADRAPALHFGFTSRPPAALVSLLVQVIEPAAEGAPQPLVWDYWGERGWTELSVRDTTFGFTRTGLVQFVGAPDALPREGLGGTLYRIRARLKGGLPAAQQVVRCGGVWLNAVWAMQGQRLDREGLGLSNGNPDQTFVLPMARAAASAASAAAGTAAAGAEVRPARAGGALAVAEQAARGAVAAVERALDQPVVGVTVLAGEQVWVREWQGRGEDWRTAVEGVPVADLRLERDAQDATLATAAWVRWHAVPHFHRSGPADRHCMVERARGLFRFPGSEGRIPPAGAPIVLSCVTGGGVAGNVPAGTLRELRSGVGFVQSVGNPLPGGGGAAAERLRAARDRSAQQLRHRDRAVSLADYEWLARQASAEVAMARALPLEGPDGRGQRGCVAVLVVPHAREALPMPSAELMREVRDYLQARMPAGLAGGLRLLPPTYVRVSVHCEVLPRHIDDAGPLEARLRARLQRFFHPLKGGVGGRGWAFGAPAWLSDVATLVSETPGVEAVRRLELAVLGVQHGDSVPVGPDQLVAAGDSQLKIIVPSASHAAA